MGDNGDIMDRIDIFIHVDIPSLDRYIDYLDGTNQKTIDELTLKLMAANVQAETSNEQLQQAVDKNQ